MAEFKPVYQIIRIESNRKGDGVDISLVKELVRCKDCKWSISCGYISTRSYAEWKDWFCADGEREVQAIKSVTMREGDTDTDGFMRKAVEAVMEVQE